uniref:PPFIA binding protein 1 n=1 Tax=Pseudonaja textilis TaxID=8673 RepID=A0A670YBS5_PSETE
MMGDASEMLAAALEQMDGIIAGSKALEYSNGLFDCQSPTSPFMGSLRVLHLVEDLRGLLEMMEIDEKEGLRCQVPDSTAEILMEWLQNQMINGHLSANGDVYQDRLTRLESDKESLVLQVSVLTDQVDAQGEKIRDLELCLEENREKLNSTEEMLQQELLSRTSLETQKLDLIAEVSNLKLKLTAVEKDRMDYEDRFRDADVSQRSKDDDSEESESPASVSSILLEPQNLSEADKTPSSTLLSSSPNHEELRTTTSEEVFQFFPSVSFPSDTFWETEWNKSPVENSKYVTLPCKSPGEEEAFGSRKARSSFGRGFFKIKSNKRTASAPNLAETEKESPDHLDLAGFPHPSKGAEGGPLTPPSPDSKKKARGIKKLFGRLRRSQSTTFNPDDMSETEFKRGGTRATAGPRLGWSRDLGQSNNDLDMPFAKWRKEQVCSWLQEQGLGFYIGNGKHWILSGQTLLQASQSDLEKELGIKHPLHRKKLQLALQALGSEEENNYGKLDYNWVTRWLDDIGLPQYKTQFDDGKVDGRMLHYMIIDDLLSLKVLSVLHHLSIKRAIQVLRMNNFEPNCLRRRPSDENNITPSEVSQWTNHRVMEWLRSVDLAEYAPNLRGSGVHGGLMVLEPRFNVETLAQLLNIPPNKTLLRRHLATHFNLLVGSKAQQEKREAMESPDYVLLTATAKVKPKKLTFSNFGNLRKKKQDDGGEEYVCPMDLGQVAGTGYKKGFKPGLDNRVYDDDDLDRLEQMEDSEGTVRQIGAFSEGINNLTHMLKEDDMFRDLATGSPSVSITDEDSNV